MMQTIYTKALSEGEWFGGWAPLPARLEWQQPDGVLFREHQTGLSGFAVKKGDEAEVKHKIVCERTSRPEAKDRSRLTNNGKFRDGPRREFILCTEAKSPFRRSRYSREFLLLFAVKKKK